MAKYINAAEAAEKVAEVHGHWISLTDCSNAGVYCSICHKKVYKEDYAWCNRKNKLRSPYCPNCGAKMDGETEGNDDNTDLKPCPFCGGDVRFDKAYSYFRDSVIYCDGCDMVFTLDDCAASDDDIVRVWNRRADNG